MKASAQMFSSRGERRWRQLTDDEDHLRAFQAPGAEGALSERARSAELFYASSRAALGPLHKMVITH